MIYRLLMCFDMIISGEGGTRNILYLPRFLYR